eukprot:m.117957 g.117957  ORF g.117957 m.117957 type:complete len:518 (+) comp15556_c0_seq13:186-1739(+)
MFFLSILVGMALAIVDAGIASRNVCNSAQAVQSVTVCHPDLAFVFVATNGRQDQLARQAIWSLQYHGQWSGPIVFISTCDKQTTTSASGSFHRVKLSSHHSSLPAFGFHQGRMAELLRFVPGHIQTAVLISPGTVFARPIKPLVDDLLDLATSSQHGFLAAFPSHAHDDTKVYSPALLAIHRTLSVPCIRSAQLAVTRGVADNSGSRTGSDRTGSTALNAVHTRAFKPPSSCYLTRLDANMLRQLSASHHTMSNSPVVSLPLPADPTIQNDDDDRDRDSNTLSLVEIESFLSQDLHVPAALRHSSAPCHQDDAPAGLIADAVTGDQRPEMTTEACAPHGVLAGYAKCATSTLHAWLLIHPEIVLPWIKEPNFDFRDRVSPEAKQYLGDLHSGKDRAFGGIKPWFTLDGSTHLAWNMTHLRNLKKFCPSTKIVVLTCDPVKRLVSHWNYRRFVWEWDFLEDKNINDVVERQLQELPDWVKQGVGPCLWEPMQPCHAFAVMLCPSRGVGLDSRLNLCNL